jgi:hypothetical protein
MANKTSELVRCERCGEILGRVAYRPGEARRCRVVCEACEVELDELSFACAPAAVRDEARWVLPLEDLALLAAEAGL